MLGDGPEPVILLPRRRGGQVSGVRRGSSIAWPATVSFLQQAVGEHDLDDRGNRLDARPVAL
jgi:hypothetical protein